MNDESDSAQQSHWKRWSGETGPFYRACAVIPFRDTTDISSKTKPEIEVTSRITRWVLRNLPAVVICGAGAIPLRLWIRTVTAAIPTRFFQNGTDASIGTLVTNPVWSSARKLAVRV